MVPRNTHCTIPYVQFHTGKHSAVNEVNYWANLRGKRNQNVDCILPKSVMVAVLAQNIKLSVTIFTATNEKKCACCLKHSVEG